MAAVIAKFNLLLISSWMQSWFQSAEITNKMQPCNRIYYSKVYWRLNMFRAAHHSSSGAPNCKCSLWFIFSHPALTTAGHHMCIYTRGCKYSLELLMMSGVPLETCWAFSKLWNNKFYYKAASCWLFLLILTTMHTDPWISKLVCYSCSQHFNFDTYSKTLLSCIPFMRHKLLVLSACTSRTTSLLADNKASQFFFIASIISPNKFPH